MTETLFNLISPWVNYYKKLEVLFAKDPDVQVIYNDEANEVKLLVQGQEKAEALQKLLPSEKTFGNVTMKINVVPPNKTHAVDLSVFKAAFNGNAAVKFIIDVDTPVGIQNYLAFVPDVVQYHNDDLFDLYGNCSTLYQEIAKDVFEDYCGNIHFCTDKIAD